MRHISVLGDDWDDDIQWDDAPQPTRGGDVEPNSSTPNHSAVHASAPGHGWRHQLPTPNHKHVQTSRYFILKSLNHHNIASAIEHGVWATQRVNEAKLNDAFRSAEEVFLIFSVNTSQHFQGYARMLSPIRSRQQSGLWAGDMAVGGQFQIAWLRLFDLPFNQTLHLKNPLNDNKPVKISRDGQELPEALGRALVALLESGADAAGVPRPEPRQVEETEEYDSKQQEEQEPQRQQQQQQQQQAFQQQLAQQQHMAQLHHNMMVMMGGQAALPMQGGFPHAAAMGAFGGAPPMQPGLDALSMQQQLAQALGQPPGAPSGPASAAVYAAASAMLAPPHLSFPGGGPSPAPMAPHAPSAVPSSSLLMERVAKQEPGASAVFPPAAAPAPAVPGAARGEVSDDDFFDQAPNPNRARGPNPAMMAAAQQHAVKHGLPLDSNQARAPSEHQHQHQHQHQQRHSQHQQRQHQQNRQLHQHQQEFQHRPMQTPPTRQAHAQRQFNKPSKFMTGPEIDSILRIQYMATHPPDSSPYAHDYYCQAYLIKRAQNHPQAIQAQRFWPESLREMLPQEKMGALPVAYVQLDGLGRVPFSNVRRPKPIMDLGGPRAPAATSEGELEGKLQPLEKEPLLAARIMIEDAMCLLLDVQDIDRLLHSQQALEHPAALHQRRTLLLEGLAQSLRLPDSPELPTTAKVDPESQRSDGVFLHLVSLPKGLTLFAHMLPLLPTNATSLRSVVWAIMRNLCTVFPATSSHSYLATKKPAEMLAVATARAVSKMDPLLLCGCSTAVFQGTTRATQSGWINKVPDSAAHLLCVLLQSAAGAGLMVNQDSEMGGGPSEQLCSVWADSFGKNFPLYVAMLSTAMGSAGSSMQGQANSIGAGSLQMIELLQATILHTNPEQRELLQRCLVSVS
mmetsp:Transcript_35186/g.66322  ORF Transcript_35186/g.66322 Transcript_35186/m.66322 type:complete len:905 (-) Transcript_35186:458-3172(-)